MADVFQLVIEAIEFERWNDLSAKAIELRQTQENKLNKVPLDDIKEALLDLEIQPAYRIIKLLKVNRPAKNEGSRTQPWDLRKQAEYNFNSGITFTIEILDSYLPWITNFAREINIRNLSYSNFIKIYEVLLVIHEKIQITHSAHIEIDLGYLSMMPELKDIEKYGDPEDYRLDVLDYLKRRKIISDYQLKEYRMRDGNGNKNGTKAKLTVDRDKFGLFLWSMRQSYKQRPKETLIFIEPPSPEESSFLKTKPAKPLSLPPNTKWEDITIKFVDGHNVDIKCKDKVFRLDYKEMGFEDSKSRKPNNQWLLLERLAENNGEIAWEKPPTDKSSDINKTSQDFGNELDDEDNPLQSKGFSIIKAPDKLKKTKQLLAQALKAYFLIEQDPFYPYDQVKAYKIRINLIA